MNTKEAIDEKINLLLNLKDLYAHSDKPNYCRIMDDCIKAIKRGKKYEAIVEEIKYEIDWHRPEREVYDSGNKGDDEYINEILDLIDRIEQRYFPKEANTNEAKMDKPNI